MDEIVKVDNQGYDAYEEMLLRRDRLRKEAHIYQGLYIKEFGDLMIAVFERKIACIRLKKTISYCQTAVNRGQTIDQNAMQEYLRTEMQEYQRRLEEMIQENENVHNMGRVTEEEASKIKRLYRKLAKLLHPDICPKTDQIPELKTLWHRITVAYNANNLEELEEAGILAQRILEENNMNGIEIDIPDLSERMEKVGKEIENIKSTDPYRYKYLLQDVDAVKEKKQELEEELSEYGEYEKELQQVVSQLMESGVKFVWRMN